MSVTLTGKEHVLASGQYIDTQAIAALASGLPAITVILNKAQILACAVTPALVIPPAAGQSLILINAVFVLNFLTAAYSGGSFAGLYYGANTNTQVLADTGILGESQNTIGYGPPNFGTNPLSAINGLGIYYTAQSNFTGGGGTLTIVANYITV